MRNSFGRPEVVTRSTSLVATFAVGKHVADSTHLILRWHSVAPETFVGMVAVGIDPGCAVCESSSSGCHRGSMQEETLVLIGG